MIIGDIEIIVKDMVAEINQAALSRATRGLNIMRNTTLEVLGHDGSGRRYGRHVASSPGSPPAPDTGNLRRNWQGQVVAGASGVGNGVRIVMRLKSKVPYQIFLEKGTRKMAPRPHVKRIEDKARPQVAALFANI